MPISLSKIHRKLLENTTAEARVLAESACKAALENLAVHEGEYRTHMSVDQRKLRNRLRARARALGDARDSRSGVQGIRHLTELAAYEHWHRLLFTRFLTENHLLITDEANGSVPITLEECEELASELGARDGFDVACRFASVTLPGVFRREDPVLELPIALNDQVELRKLLGALPSECFIADDGLGWTYQFWQAQRKDEVNASGKKIGADELAPVTQLFTEDYMVEFLLHNTLGAWWAGRLGAIKADTEEEARAQVALPARDGIPAISWNYLRFVWDEVTKTWLPAAGTFNGWPKKANLISMLDPCMGSGHFLVFALPLLVRLRMEEEGLDPKAAVVAALNDNIHGLELDERCTQIAAFNVALTAWRLAGHQGLPALHLACSGLAPSATRGEWLALAGEDDRLQRGMVRLFDLFKDAPILGSLINPRAHGGRLIEADFHELAPLLSAALSPNVHQKGGFEDDAAELGVIAQGLAKAAELLAKEFVLVATNVPYLGYQKMDASLGDYSRRSFPYGKSDLATCFVERCLQFCSPSCSACMVTPQNWLFLSSYRKLRESLLDTVDWRIVARLGSGAFETIGGEVVNVALITLTKATPGILNTYPGVDCSSCATPSEKARRASAGEVLRLTQNDQRRSPDSRIGFSKISDLPLLGKYSDSYWGLGSGDGERFCYNFWEIPSLPQDWECLQVTFSPGGIAVGKHQVVFWQRGEGTLYQLAEDSKLKLKNIWQRGHEAWGKKGVAISQMGGLHATLYQGEIFQNGVAAIIPKALEDLAPIWAFCSSSSFTEEVRKLDQKLAVTNATLIKVPFDLAHWQKEAALRYPHGLPKPFSSDPAQWLFNGHPKGSDQPLHVAIARLLGYRWPRQTGSSFPDCPAISPDGLESFANNDGIVCLPPVNREQAAANRLRQLLTAALGTFDERALIAAAGLNGSKSKTLEEWLRDEFFEQHVKLFHDRPFIWHLWDGRSDGFHALVNYHKLDHANLQKLTYSYLGNWIQQQAEDTKSDKPGAAARLGAARELQTRFASILEGEAPLDIFVRWKPTKDQARSWRPDLNDGVRQNIRPFLCAGDVGKRGAGLFRVIPLALKDSDRGTDPERPNEEYPWLWCEDEPGTDPVGGKKFVGTRWNNVHLTLERKRRSRA